MTTYNAFAHDNTGHPGPDPDTGDDGAYAPDGITIEDATGREVAWLYKDFRWPAGKFDPGFADEALGRMGFRRTGPWEDLHWDWRAPLVVAKDGG
jgi:hypothetical protein